MPGFDRSYTVATLEVPPKVFELIRDKLVEAGYGRHYIEGQSLDLSGVALVPSDKADETPWHLSRSSAVAVGDHEFMPIETAPKGVKVQLLTEGHIATHGFWLGPMKTPGMKGWYPIPGIPAAWKSQPHDPRSRTEKGDEPWAGQPDLAS
jgi:hypothetical protein